MWCSTAWPSTRSKLSSAKRQRLGVAGHRRHRQAEPRGVALQRLEHPGGDVRAHGRAHDARLHQVQREVARAGADLQRAAERLGLAPQRLAQLGQHLVLADLAEVDAPLGVVVVRGGVVVAGVDVADLGRCGGSRHRVAKGSVQRAGARDVPPTRPAGRRAAARADRRAHAARRAGGELLVPPPPRRLRVDRRARGGPARHRHGLRRGLRRGRAGRAAARSVVGVDANPEAHEHAAAALRARRTCASRATSSRPIDGECDASSFLQTIEHVEDPGDVLEHFKSLLRPGGTAYVSTPNVLTLAPEGAERSGNPWHVHEYRAEEFRRLLRAALRARRAATGSSTRASCASTSWR